MVIMKFIVISALLRSENKSLLSTTSALLFLLSRLTSMHSLVVVILWKITGNMVEI